MAVAQEVGAAFLHGGGEAGALIAAHDWSLTSLGPIETWPQSLRTTTSLLLRSSVPLLLKWGEDGIMLYNDAYAAFAGDRHPGLLGAKVREGWSEVAEFADHVVRVGLAGGTLSYKDQEMTLHRHGRAERVFMNLDYSPVLDERGQPAGVLVIVVETTGRVMAERRRDLLLRLDDRLRDVSNPADLSYAASELVGEALAAVRVGYGVFDRTGRTLTVERNWCAPGFVSVAGLHRCEDYGAFLEDEVLRGVAVTNADVATDARSMPQVAAFRAFGIGAHMDVPVMEDGRAAAYMLVHAAEPRAWADEEVALVREVATRTRAAVARRLAEAQLRASEARLRELNETLERRVADALAERKLLADLVENARTFIQVADEDYRLLAVNRASADEFERIYGVRPEVGDSILDLLADRPEHRSAVKAAWDRALTGEAFVEVAEFGDPRFDRRFVEMKFNPLSDADGRRVGAYQFAYDVTERVQAEARLADAEEQLRQAQKMEAVGQLTGGIAHDFNNLLTGIMGSLELLQSQATQGRYDQLERFTGMAVTSAQRAAALTQRLLAFSRRQPLDPKPVEANALVASMEELLRRTLGPSVGLEFKFSGRLWLTLCDPNQLESAILNLAINARDAMPDGGHLSIETANANFDDAHAGEGEAGEYVVVSVADTGIGIPRGQIERIFEPFFTTKPIGQGTGLGLSQLYGFAKQSGGHVRVRSEEGQGTTFKLYLPRHRGEVVGTAAHETEAEVPMQAGKGETVLVVDDEAMVRMLVTETVEELGYAVLEGVDGPSALDVLRSDRRIELLVTDVGLPGLNGRQLADAARALRPELKVLFITGYAGNAAVGQGMLDAGMEILSKPFAMEQLAGKVREMMRPK